MTFIVVERPDNGWGQVPRRLPDDSRLSLPTRAAACWILTRTDDFILSIKGLCTCLGLGKDAWRRIRGELEAAGYLQIETKHGVGGQFKSELVFHPVPVGGFPVENSKTAGSPPKSAKKRKKTAGQPVAGAPLAVEPPAVEPQSTRDLKGQGSLSLSGVASGDKEKEVADRNFAVEQGLKNGLAKSEIDEILGSCRWPSEMPRAMLKALSGRKKRASGSSSSGTPEPEQLAIARARARLMEGRRFLGANGEDQLMFCHDNVKILRKTGHLWRTIPFENAEIVAVLASFDAGRITEIPDPLE